MQARSLFLVLICAANLLWAQEPSYSVIGENELSGVDIYSIIQDASKNVLITTDQGLIIYDGYAFRRLPVPALKSESLFGLTADRNGRVFCFNLSGQILLVRNDSLELYYEIPPAYLAPSMSITFDQENHLIIAGKVAMRVSPAKELEIISLPFPESSLTPDIEMLPDGRIVFSGINSDSLCFWLPRKLDCIPNPTKIEAGFVIPIVTPTETYYFTNANFEIFRSTSEGLHKIPLDTRAIPRSAVPGVPRVSKDGSSWFPTRSGGAYAFDANGQARFEGQLIFKSFYISGFLEDHEGNLWFPTLGDGMLFIPNPALTSYSGHPAWAGERFTKVSFDNSGNAYIGTQSGKIFRFPRKGPIEKIYDNPERKITLLKYFADYPFLLTTEYRGNLSIDPVAGTTEPMKFRLPAKDMCIIGTRKRLWGTMNGVMIEYGENDSTRLFPIGRAISVYYHEAEKRAWIATIHGLFYLDDGAEPIKFGAAQIAPTDITGSGEQLWVAGTKAGLYRIRKGKIHTRLGPGDGLLSTQIRKIRMAGTQLYISHNRGLQIYDTQSGQFRSFNMTDGLAANQITDFDVFEDRFCILTARDLQFFKLADLQAPAPPPAIEITRIEVNDSLIELPGDAWFSHTRNHFTFEFKGKGFQHRGTFQYLFQLEGLDEAWKSANFSENRVRYGSLPPGSYVFQVKAVSQTGLEGPADSYAFTIASPFWVRWWFIALVLLAILALAYLGYAARVRQLRRKNELSASKLTALQSQMNPHFIFNALNSIQDLVLKEDIEQSYHFITQFSHLIRRTLDYSGHDFIDLDDEIQLLTIYLELEKLRFKDDFEYTLETIDTDGIRVPPLLIQPFVENALKHGLLHSPRPKKLSVVFKLDEDLTCTITDNGVGREKAEEIRVRQGKTHASFSGAALTSRLQILREHYGTNAGLVIEDLFEAGTAAGTKVVVSIPFKRAF